MLGMFSKLVDGIRHVDFEESYNVVAQFAIDNYYIVAGVSVFTFLIILCLFLVVCVTLISSFWLRRVYEYGRFTKGYPHNIFLHFLLDKPENNEEEEIEEPNDEEIEELMNVSRFTHPEYLKDDYDVIIVGSGLSALSSAGFLSRAGKKCLILEAHDRFGGCCHSYEEMGYGFCSGIHYINDAENTMFKWPIDIISNSQIKIESIDDIQREKYRYSSRTVELEGHLDLNRLPVYLTRRFPEEQDGLEKFFYHAKKCRGSYQQFIASRSVQFPLNLLLRYVLGYEKTFKYYSKFTAYEILDKCGIKDAALRSLLTSNQGLISTHPPEEFIFPLCVLFLDIGWKKSRVVGGGAEFPRKIIANLKIGSKAVHHCRVKKILVKGAGRSSKNGVVLESGERIYAPTIISSAGIQKTHQMLPSKHMPFPALEKASKDFESTGHYFLVHIGCDVPPEELGLGQHQQVVLYGGSDDRVEIYRNMMENVHPPHFEGFEDGYSVAMLIDINQKKKSEGKHFSTTLITLLVNCNLEWFQEFSETQTGKRGTEYEQWKDNYRDKCIKVVYEEYPKIEEHVEYIDSATSLTLRDYLFTPNGGAYGMNLSFEKIDYVVGNRDVYNPAKGIFLVGQDISGDGVMPAVYSSFYAVGDIIGRNLFIDHKNAEDFVHKNRFFHKEKKD